MNGLDRYEDEVWDRFFNFISQPVQTMTREEVQAELQKRGIDVSRAVSKVHQAVASARARANLAEARAKRVGIVEKLNSVVAPAVDGLRERMAELIGGRLQGTAQAAYFRKLQEAAGEEDLRRLLDDIQRLEALGDDDETDNGPT